MHPRLPRFQALPGNVFDEAPPRSEEAEPLLADRGEITLAHEWYYGFDLAIERYRGLCAEEDHLQAATLETTLAAGKSLTVVATTDAHSSLNGADALHQRQRYEQSLIQVDATLWYFEVVRLYYQSPERSWPGHDQRDLRRRSPLYPPRMHCPGMGRRRGFAHLEDNSLEFAKGADSPNPKSAIGNPKSSSLSLISLHLYANH